MRDYAAQQRNPAKHALGITLVVLLHVVLIYALINGLAMKVIKVIRAPIETKIIQQAKPPPKAPPPPPPKLVKPPPPYIPPPVVNIQQPPKQTIQVVTRVEHPPPPPPPRVPNTPVGLSLSAADEGLLRSFIARHLRYPRMALQNGDQGTAIVQVTMQADGTVLNVKIIKRSGYFTLDRAARRVFLQNGKLPELNDLPPGHIFVFSIPVVFKLS